MPTAKAHELAQCMPVNKAGHVRALCGGLQSVRSSLLYITEKLERVDMGWVDVQDKVAHELTCASMFLSGILDGCIIAELPADTVPDKSINFYSKEFRDPTLLTIQKTVRSLRSFYEDKQDVQASLSTVTNFWKHYLPYQPLPTMFTRDRLQPLYDFKLQLCNPDPEHAELKAFSGPVVHDLLIPAFNAACSITDRLLELLKVGREHRVPPIIMSELTMVDAAAVAADVNQRFEAIRVERGYVSQP